MREFSALLVAICVFTFMTSLNKSLFRSSRNCLILNISRGVATLLAAEVFQRIAIQQCRLTNERFIVDAILIKFYFLAAGLVNYAEN